MPLETLEEVRLLSNLETHRHKLMQIVLFGQPELDRKLEQRSIRQLRERITHSFNLEPLSIEETRAYLHFRLHSAGENQPMILPRHVKVAIADSAYKSMGSYAGGERRLPAWLGYPVAALVGALALWAVLGWQRGSDPAVMPVYSVAASEGAQLEEFLEFLSLSGLLEQTWLCRISANSQRPEQWLVLHGEFPGVSDSRRFIEGLPTFVRQRGPYVRNLDGIACANAGA